jgi:hypothetical protein
MNMINTVRRSCVSGSAVRSLSNASTPIMPQYARSVSSFRVSAGHLVDGNVG